MEHVNSSTQDQSLASLVSGIVSDAQELIKQQFVLLTREMRQELNQAKNAAISVGVGVAITAVGGFFLLFTLVYLLKEYTTLPMWACFGIVGGTLVAAGVAFLFLGKKEAANVDIALPPETTESLKENWQWLKHPTTGVRS